MFECGLIVVALDQPEQSPAFPKRPRHVHAADRGAPVALPNIHKIRSDILTTRAICPRTVDYSDIVQRVVVSYPHEVTIREGVTQKLHMACPRTQMGSVLHR